MWAACLHIDWGSHIPPETLSQACDGCLHKHRKNTFPVRDVKPLPLGKVRSSLVIALVVWLAVTCII